MGGKNPKFWKIELVKSRFTKFRVISLDFSLGSDPDFFSRFFFGKSGFFLEKKSQIFLKINPFQGGKCPKITRCPLPFRLRRSPSVEPCLHRSFFRRAMLKSEECWTAGNPGERGRRRRHKKMRPQPAGRKNATSEFQKSVTTCWKFTKSFVPKRGKMKVFFGRKCARQWRNTNLRRGILETTRK